MNFINSITVMVSVFFGLLLGMSALTAAAYFGGFIDFDETGQAKSDVQSQTPGMDILNEYSCRIGETKQILLGGTEDNYSPEGDETLPETAYQKSYAAYAGSGPRNRDYDQGGQDLSLLQYFHIPKNTAHGIYVVRMKSLSSIQNDGISIGSHPDNFLEPDRVMSGGIIHTLSSVPGWRVKKDLYSVGLDGLQNTASTNSDSVETILGYIRGSELPTRKTGIKIADDTMVDFMGLSLCLGPEKNRGTVFTLVDPFDVVLPANENLENWPSNTAWVSFAELDGVVCSPYTGCESCSNSLPLACFKGSGLPVPQVNGWMAKFWSGGEIKLTPAVQGNRFETANDVNGYCRRLFGQNWRALSSNDGSWQGRILVRQIQNTKAENFWIDIKGQPHGNCWAQRSEAGGGNE